MRDVRIPGHEGGNAQVGVLHALAWVTVEPSIGPVAGAGFDETQIRALGYACINAAEELGRQRRAPERAQKPE